MIPIPSVGTLWTRKLSVAAESLDIFEERIDIAWIESDTGDWSQRFYYYVVKVADYIMTKEVIP